MIKEISYKRLKKAYKHRKSNKDSDIIVVDGAEFIPNYLKYLLMYMKENNIPHVTYEDKL